jgi:hypothetical protein
VKARTRVIARDGRVYIGIVAAAWQKWDAGRDGFLHPPGTHSCIASQLELESVVPAVAPKSMCAIFFKFSGASRRFISIAFGAGDEYGVHLSSCC